MSNTFWTFEHVIYYGYVQICKCPTPSAWYVQRYVQWTLLPECKLKFSFVPEHVLYMTVSLACLLFFFFRNSTFCLYFQSNMLLIISSIAVLYRKFLYVYIYLCTYLYISIWNSVVHSTSNEKNVLIGDGVIGGVDSNVPKHILLVLYLTQNY